MATRRQAVRRSTAATAIAVTMLASGAAGSATAGAPPVTTNVVFTGDTMVVAGIGVARLSIAVSASDPACVVGRTVRIRSDIDQSGSIDADERWVITTAGDGTAGVEVTGVPVGVSQVVFDVDATPTCAPSGLGSELFSADPGAKASGNGRYEHPGIGRAHLSFSATTRVSVPGNGRPPTMSVRGDVNWRMERIGKFTGTVKGYTTWCPPQFSTTPGARCGMMQGTGTLWLWNPSGPGRGGWVKQPGEVWFSLLVEDGATPTDDGRRCTVVGPDRVRIYLPGFEFLSKTSALIPLTHGRIDVR